VIPFGPTELLILGVTIVVGLIVFRHLNARDSRDGGSLPRRRAKRPGDRRR
jgi:hypothetical protein